MGLSRRNPSIIPSKKCSRCIDVGDAVRPVCASSPAIVSVRSWSSIGWVVPRGSTREVGCWNGGARVGPKYSSSGRPLTPARRSGRVGSRRDPSDGEVSSVVGFCDPLPRRGAEAYIVGVVGHPYLTTWLPLWLTMLLHTSTMPAVLAVGHASSGKGVGLTCARPVVRPLAPPYLRPANFPRRIDHVDGPVVRGRADLDKDAVM
ncbi:hypothetical protein GW17_00021970 [Ensete ventricosum]|nr:hypothetical protein GW17_00021970 [Ensete ventricosum]